MLLLVMPYVALCLILIDFCFKTVANVPDAIGV